MSESPSKGPFAWVAVLILVALGAFGLLPTDAPVATDTPASGAAPAPADRSQAEPSPADAEPSATERRSDLERPSELVVDGPRGATDLVPTLRRIERGERHEHRNDGSVFQNRERRLPNQPRGYYREYVHPTPDVRGPGAQRLVIGRDGDIWYTPDHYESFERIRWRLEMGNGR